jgi:hypothetical protein
VCWSVVCLLPLLAGAGAAGTVDSRANLRRIEAMPAADRERLEQNFQVYLALPEASRAIYRQLHEALEEDTRAGGKLHAVLDAYSAWLKTLSPWQREELRKTEDPIVRRNLVRQFREEQKNQEQQERRVVYPGDLGSGLGRIAGFGPRLSSADLKSVMAVIEEHTTFSPERRRKVQSLEGLERYLLVLQTVVNPEVALPQFERSRWPEPPLIDHLVRAISDPRQREMLLAMPGLEQRRPAVLRLLVGGLLSEMQLEAERRKPSDEELQKLFVQLDGRQRDELMSLPPEQFRRRLALIYFSQHRDQFTVDVGKFREVFERLFQRASGRPPGRPFLPPGPRS